MFKMLCACALLFAGCAMDDPQFFQRPDGSYDVVRHKRFIGMEYDTEVEVVKTDEQVEKEIEHNEAQAKSAIKIKRSDRQENFAFWLGSSLLVGAVACVLFGLLVKGYAFWGMMAAACATLGSLSFGFAHWLPYLKWGPAILFGMSILWIMSKAKNFSLVEKIRDIKERLDGTSK